MIICKTILYKRLNCALQAIYRRVYEFGVEEKRTLSWQDATVDLSKDSIQKDDKTIFCLKQR